MSPAATVSLPNVRGGVQQEIYFAQRLADNDKKNRDKALRKLKKFLVLKSSASRPGFSDDDAIKLWKGLFYCMYMADKPLVQEEVAEVIAHLIHDLGNKEDCYTFTKAAFRTFAREWNGIDTFRIDKFMMFMRRVLRQVFVQLKLDKWDLKEVCIYVNILDTSIVCADDNTNSTPLGIKLHLCSVILEELAKIGGEDLSHEVIMAVIQPFLKVLAISKIKEYRDAVRDDIIHHLMRQTELGVEGEEKIQNPRGRSLPSLPNEEDGGGDDVAEEEEMMELNIDEAVLDPRAGSVDVCIPQLQPNFGHLADALESLGSLKKVSKVSRKILYKLVEECRDMAGGLYPLGIEEPSMEIEPDVIDEEEEMNAVTRLKEFYKNLATTTTADVKDMEDFKADPFKNYAIRKGYLSKSKKKKLKRLEKKVRTLTEKKKIAKQQAAAEQNRKLAVQNQISKIATVHTPSTPALPESNMITKEMKKKKKKAQKKGKEMKVGGFEVSAISPAEKKINVPADVTTFEVTPISKGKAGKKRKDMQVLEKSPKKLKSSEVVEILEPVVPEKTKAKKKKKKATKVEVSQVLGSTSSKGKAGETPLPLPEKGVVTAEEIPMKITESKDSELGKMCTTSKVSSSKKETSGQQKVDLKAIGNKKNKKVKAKGQETPVVKASFDSDECQQKADKVKANEVNNLETLKVGVKKLEEVKASALETLKADIVSNSKETVNLTPKREKKPILKMQGKGKGLVLNISNEESGSVWSKPLKEKEIEFFIKNTRNMKTEKKRKSSLASPKVTPKTPREKTIKINLKQNKEHELRDYVHSVRNSPQIPFSADKVPKAPVLKPSPSPILIGRPGLKILKNHIKKSSPVTKVASPSMKKSPKAKRLQRSKASDFF